MNRKSKNDYSRSIEEKRFEMLEEAKKYGINSEQVLKRSKELDDLIISCMKKHNK